MRPINEIAAIARAVRLSVVAAAGMVLFTVNAASAASLYVNFCPGDATCPNGVTEASLLFEEDLATLDPNDYDVTVTIAGDTTAPAYVDEVSFILSGVQWTDYDEVSLTGAPASGGLWAARFDNVSGSAGSCVENTGQQHAVCAQSGPGDASNYGAVLPGQTLEWNFYINLADSVGPITTTDVLNLRVQFLNAAGKNVGILSPDGKGTSVPEPGTLLLFGVGGLALMSLRRAFP